MAKSPRYVDRYTDIRKWSEAEMAREKSLQDEIDAAAKRYQRKERLCFLGVCLGYLAIGVFGAYCFYIRQS